MQTLATSHRNDKDELILPPGESTVCQVSGATFWAATLPPSLLGINAPIGDQRVKVYVGGDKQLWAWVPGRGQVTIASDEAAKRTALKFIDEPADRVLTLSRLIGILDQ